MMKEDVSQVKVALWVRVEDSEIFAQPPSIEKINIVAAKLPREMSWVEIRLSLPTLNLSFVNRQGT